MTKEKHVIGGGFKKVLYTLNTVRRIGVKNAAKALTAQNACKACGLGMGGQRGGMVNELDEYPSVCNKSVQAQSTDIQGPIPLPVFEHTLDEFKELSAQEIERLGRLGVPLFKAKGANKFVPVSWDDALELAINRFKSSAPERSFFMLPVVHPMKLPLYCSWWRAFMAVIILITVPITATRQPVMVWRQPSVLEQPQ